MPTSELRVERLHSSECDALRLSEFLDEKALETLVLITTIGTRFPKECEAWNNRRIEIEKRFQKIRAISQRQAEIHVEKVACEVDNEEEKELKVSRIEFVRKIEELSRERSKS